MDQRAQHFGEIFESEKSKFCWIERKNANQTAQRYRCEFQQTNHTTTGMRRKG